MAITKRKRDIDQGAHLNGLVVEGLEMPPSQVYSEDVGHEGKTLIAASALGEHTLNCGLSVEEVIEQIDENLMENDRQENSVENILARRRRRSGNK